MSQPTNFTQFSMTHITTSKSTQSLLLTHLRNKLKLSNNASRKGLEGLLCPKIITNGVRKFKPFLLSTMLIPMKKLFQSFITCSRKKSRENSLFHLISQVTMTLPLQEDIIGQEWLLVLLIICSKTTVKGINLTTILIILENLQKQFSSMLEILWFKTTEMGVFSWWGTIQELTSRGQTKLSGVPSSLKRECIKGLRMILRIQQLWWFTLFRRQLMLC